MIQPEPIEYVFGVLNKTRSAALALLRERENWHRVCVSFASVHPTPLLILTCHSALSSGIFVARSLIDVGLEDLMAVKRR